MDEPSTKNGGETLAVTTYLKEANKKFNSTKTLNATQWKTESNTTQSMKQVTFINFEITLKLTIFTCKKKRKGENGGGKSVAGAVGYSE